MLYRYLLDARIIIQSPHKKKSYVNGKDILLEEVLWLYKHKLCVFT